MRAPISWLADHVDLPAGLSPRAIGDALVRVGLEVEKVESAAEGITGPIVVGRVLSFEAEEQKNGKTIRWCSVDVGESEPRGIVCGAANFAVGDLIVAVLPGATLPGGFEISARKTYGHVSDGMICSARELGIGEDHSGILVLDPDAAKPGDDALSVLGLDDAVLDIAITPDRGYCLSVRGLAREAGAALGVPFHDVTVTVPVIDGDAYPVTVSDSAGCDQFSARAVTGLDPAAVTPSFIANRLRAAGMRSISLTVDVTNYVMLETGQPLHAFDRARLAGELVVRRAEPGEKLTTLDGSVRVLDPDDLVVTDDSGAIALAGVMGGASTEIGTATTDVVLEAAHWDPASISRAVRRHKLPSEAAKRFERGVDPAIAAVALQRCVDLLVEYGGAAPAPGFTVVGDGPAVPSIPLSVELPATLSGLDISADTVRARLEQVGCLLDTAETSESAPADEQTDPAGRPVEAGTSRTRAGAHHHPVRTLSVRPPSWRPDLTDPVDLVEEVVRLEGYDRIPSTLPPSPAGTGLTEAQRVRRAISRALGSAGYVEVLSYPFVAPSVHDAFGLPADDPRRRAVRLVNPLSDAEPEMRTSLLPGLLANLARNVGRGNRDLALFETGLVYQQSSSGRAAPRPGVEHRPSDEQLAEIAAALPIQPRHAAVVFGGEVELAGWWGPGRPADFSDAVEAARVIARAARVRFEVRVGNVAPWHPGRCAELFLDGTSVGYAGELHPRVVAELGLPARTCAMELDLDKLPVPVPPVAPELSAFPPVLLDLALVVPLEVSAADLTETLRAGAGQLLESIRLFDVYADAARLGSGVKSLAFACKFRAPDRTLTVEDATLARDAAVAAAAQRFGARLRA
ncbi:phenylalanine--tRNA ligase subunit beta [Jatrophihabitans telluris]|uniref:Phenylalanine--tRNA ligase beta subunit n=1 Tax=Jatrophihabitans telluris TaxID=2038343 RepID=A0ABY4R2Z5_9ACTN|nr:phenylalanine--tRNA ligase subunit beta [Jatrophihabitans telluris]UQX90100.1 phenylalanine--tRNA ligase subunit beta [Jatrophihabitans telluris]